MSQFQQIIASLRALSSEEKIEKAKTMYPTSMDVLGISNPDLRTVVDELYEKMKDEPRSWYMSLSDALMNSNILECELLVWWLLEKAKIIPTLTNVEMQKLKGTLDNWVSVDTFGITIYGKLWQLGTVVDLEVYALQEFDDVWHRRLALVAVVALNTKSRGGIGDVHRTLVVCERAVGDNDDMIVKALSWALRSLIAWDRYAVEEFLKKHEDALPGRVKREVGNKLDHGTKN